MSSEGEIRTEGRPREDTGRRRLSTRQGEGRRDTSAADTPSPHHSDLWCFSCDASRRRQRRRGTAPQAGSTAGRGPGLKSGAKCSLSASPKQSSGPGAGANPWPGRAQPVTHRGCGRNSAQGFLVFLEKLTQTGLCPSTPSGLETWKEDRNPGHR